MWLIAMRQWSTLLFGGSFPKWQLPTFMLRFFGNSLTKNDEWSFASCFLHTLLWGSDSILLWTPTFGMQQLEHFFWSQSNSLDPDSFVCFYLPPKLLILLYFLSMAVFSLLDIRYIGLKLMTCYSLKVCVPMKFIWWSPNPKVVV